MGASGRRFESYHPDFLLIMTFINYLKINSSAIIEWSKCLHEEETDMFQTGATIKPLLNPIFKREDLLNKELLCLDNVRQITYINLFPGCEVCEHTHEYASYFVMENKQPIYFPAETNYKTTHFVLESNPNAYFVFDDKIYTWERGKFDELEVIYTPHYAVNPGPTNVRLLYFDYY